MEKDTKRKKQEHNIWKYISRYKFPIFLYIFCVALIGACTILYTIFLAKTIEFITLREYISAIYTLFFVLGFAVIERLFTYFANFLYFKYSSMIMKELSIDLARQAFKLSSKTYSDHDTGTFVQRIVSDPEHIVDNMASIIDYVAEIITAVIMLGYIISLNVWISLVLFVTIIIGIIIEVYRNKTLRKNRFVMRRCGDRINSLTTEIVRSEKDVKSLGLENKLSEVSNENYEKFKKIRYKTNMTDVRFWTVRDIFIKAVSILILILGVWFIDRGLITLATFMIVYSNTNSLISLVRNIGRIGNNLTSIKVSSSRMFSIFDEEEFVTEKFGDISLKKINGEIEFRKVSFSFKEYQYKERTNKNEKPEKILVSENQIFKNLSFKIEPNTTVAFVGISGSGKSTILNLLSKMYEVDSGEVLIDRYNINDLDKQSLKSGIALVNQFPYIFDMTIKENLLLAKEDATDKEIKRALKMASLDKFVETLPEGVETRVGESGIKLSGGQKQRLAIARSFLKKSSVILFDESTSSLDNFAQDDIKRSIAKLKGKSTVVIVAHRLSTIRNVDKIFFLSKGKIVDSGTFDYLYEHNKQFKVMFLVENLTD